MIILIFLYYLEIITKICGCVVFVHQMTDEILSRNSIWNRSLQFEVFVTVEHVLKSLITLIIN